MKRFIFSILVVCASVYALNAQSMNNLSKASMLAYNYLASEGFTPSLDEDNDVAFKAQGFNFYIDNYKDDATYLRIVMPNIKTIDSDSIAEMFAAMAACNDINKTKKLVKATLSDTGRVSISAQTYLGNCSDVSEFLDTSIDFIVSAAKEWYKTYNELME